MTAVAVSTLKPELSVDEKIDIVHQAVAAGCAKIIDNVVNDMIAGTSQDEAEKILRRGFEQYFKVYAMAVQLVRSEEIKV